MRDKYREGFFARVGEEEERVAALIRREIVTNNSLLDLDLVSLLLLFSLLLIYLLELDIEICILSSLLIGILS
jgi:hypothetical protein